jgi:hypothetical protein
LASRRGCPQQNFVNGNMEGEGFGGKFWKADINKNENCRKKTKKVLFFFATIKILTKFATPIKRDVL